MRNSWNKNKRFKFLSDQKGSVSIFAYFSVVVLLGIGAVFMLTVVDETTTTKRQQQNTTAFHIAEAGIERGLFDLRSDYIGIEDPSWSDGDINGFTIGPDTTNYYQITYSDTSLNGGSYTVEYKNIAGLDDQMWVRSTGIYNDSTHTIEIYVRITNSSPWNYAIFAGEGASGQMVNGNVIIAGSVLILGTGLNPGDLAMDLGGTSELVQNNYNDLETALLDKVPDLPTVLYNGETVSTLNSVLRVKNGVVGLSGSATVGQSDVSGNSVKETVDGVYTNEGFGGNKGAANVSSDNGTSALWDLGDELAFPSLSDPYPGYATYQAYLKANALVLNTELDNITPGSNFSYSDGKGTITMDGSGNMTVSGIVYVDGDNDFNISGGDINYTGTGALLVTGNVGITSDFVTSGDDSFPANNVGIMTPNNISFSSSQLNVMGVFYAEDTLSASHQTDIMGSVMANYFDMGSNVPKIFQVPDVVNNLPAGMIGGNTNWYLVVAWIKS